MMFFAIANQLDLKNEKKGPISRLYKEEKNTTYLA